MQSKISKNDKTMLHNLSISLILFIVLGVLFEYPFIAIYRYKHLKNILC